MFIGLVTPEPTLQRHYGSGLRQVVADSAISRGSFRQQKPTILLGAFTPESHPTPANFERFLLGQTKGVEACLLLVDREWEFLIENIRSAVLCQVFDRGTVGSSPMNFFHRETSRLLRGFSTVHTSFASGSEMQALCLPRRNFDATELREIVRLCCEDWSKRNFREKFDEQLKLLRRRRQPLRANSSGKRYFVDDRRRYFEFGPEKHAQFPTGEPHLPYCAFNGYFRFGHRIDSTRHYNVTAEAGDRTSIEGEFDDCHGTRLAVRRTTHLNMFSNDYF